MGAASTHSGEEEGGEIPSVGRRGALLLAVEMEEARLEGPGGQAAGERGSQVCSHGKLDFANNQ